MKISPLLLLGLPLYSNALTLQTLPETIGGLNLHLQKIPAIAMPSPLNDNLYHQVELLAKNKKQATTQAYWTLTTHTSLPCSAYSGQDEAPVFATLNDLQKKAEAEVLKEGSWKKGLSLAELWWKLSGCEAPVLLNAWAVAHLNHTIEKTLTQLPQGKLSATDRKELATLKSRLGEFRPPEAIRKSIRYEIVAASTNFVAQIQNGKIPLSTETHWFEGPTPLPEGFLGLMNLIGPLGEVPYDWKKEAAHVSALLDATADPDLNRITALANEKRLATLQDYFLALQLFENGLSSGRDLLDERKAKSLQAKLLENPALLAQKRSLMKNYPRQAEFITNVYLLPLVVQPYADTAKKWEERHKKILSTVNRL